MSTFLRKTPPPFLHPGRRAYYRRVTIPKILRPLFANRVEVWRSLKTTDKDTASIRAAAFDADTKRLFVALKKHGEAPASSPARLSKERIDDLVQRWL